jgi:hypothetical protein
MGPFILPVVGALTGAFTDQVCLVAKTLSRHSCIGKRTIGQCVARSEERGGAQGVCGVVHRRVRGECWQSWQVQGVLAE